MQTHKLFSRSRSERGSALLEVTIAIAIFSLIATGTTAAVSSTVNAATTHMLRSSVTTQANIVIAYVGGVSPEPSFRAVANCPDEPNVSVAGLTLVPPSDAACVRVWGTVAHERLPDYTSASYDASVDRATFVPTSWTVEITDPSVADGTRVTFTSASSSVTYEEGLALPTLSAQWTV